MQSRQLTKTIDNLTRWLIFSPIRAENGGIISWNSPRADGFFYPEVTGYLLQLLLYLEQKNNDCRYLTESRRIYDCLLKCLKEQDGIIRQRNFCYAFDNGIILRAMLSAGSRLKVQLPNDLLNKTLNFLIQCLNNKTAGYPIEGQINDRHWSRIYSPHLLKIIPLLFNFSEQIPNAKEIALTMISDFHETLFVAPIYSHAMAYALEGVLWLKTSGFSGLDKIINRGLKILTDLQNEEGGILNYSDQNPSRFPASDATAQAVRLWLLSDPAKYQTNILKALNFLLNHQIPGGGMLYGSKSPDQNSCATIFTVQALCFHLGAPKTEDLI